MLIFWRVPLPWLNLIHDKGRLVFRVLGTAFAVLLLFVELGFLDALQEAPVKLIEQFNGPLVIVSKAHYALNIKEPFLRRHLAAACAVPGVKQAFPLYLEHPAALWKDTRVPVGKRGACQPIRAIAFDPRQPVLNEPEVIKHRDALKVPYNILLDRKSKEDIYGNIQNYLDSQTKSSPELAGHKVHVKGLFTLGADFANDGNVIMSAETFAQLFGEGLPTEYVLDKVDVGIVQVMPNANVQAIYQSLKRTLPEDVRVFTKEKFIEREKAYWRNSTPMGFIFILGLCVGVIVGGVICYQIISTDVAEYLPQFATLKAIGYSNSFVCGVVLREAVWLALIGFAPGWGLSWLLYWQLSRAIGLPMEMAPLNVLLVALFTIFMCMVAGLVALIKVWTTDPAEVFA